MSDESRPVRELSNIGDVLAAELESVGIHTLEDLRRCGSAGALLLIRGASGKGCMNMLYALEGTIQGIRWHSLAKSQKDAAKAELERVLHDKKN